ncbi:MAG: serpin family protein [Prolixibacteraceae bacterium]|nr:serpin family protein [Prolixibacteraceae bacterium]
MKTQILLFPVLIILLAMFSCDKGDDVQSKKIDVTLKSQKIVEADNEFGLDIFKRIYENEEQTNFMISPLSISMALSMAYNGAETETKTEMAEALGIDEFTRDEINETYRSLIDALTTVDPKVAMEIANSIWYSDRYHVEQSFLDVNSTHYDAEVNEADFSDPGTVGEINQWVSNKTHEKIPEIINDISPEMVLFLINAIYFNGTWSQEFNPESTQELSFEISEGNYVQVDMMGRIDTLDYLKNDIFSAIKLPYGDGNFNMMVLLPDRNNSVEEVINLFSAENWEKWNNDFSETENIDIRLPKFKIEYEKTLNDFLKAMGMKLAFTAMADFSGINPARDLFISFVKHKTFIEVDEEGTEAAAVTIIGFENTSAGPSGPQKIYFHCDRPFLFAITERDTGAILFLGKVGNPALEP